MSNKPKPVLRPKRKMIGVTPWAHARLQRMLEKLSQQVHDHPEWIPSLVGRRMTYSDVIVILSEKYLNESA